MSDSVVFVRDGDVVIDALLSVEDSDVGRGGVFVSDVEVVEVSVGVGDVVCLEVGARKFYCHDCFRRVVVGVQDDAPLVGVLLGCFQRPFVPVCGLRSPGESL